MSDTHVNTEPLDQHHSLYRTEHDSDHCVCRQLGLIQNPARGVDFFWTNV